MVTLENNWKQKTIESLEKKVWTSLNKDEGSYLIRICNDLRKKKLTDFTTEDLRIMIGQEIGLNFLIPLALETLTNELFAEGDYYEGDLLKNVLEINTEFWNNNKNYWLALNELTKDRREEILEMQFDFTNFDKCKHRQ